MYKYNIEVVVYYYLSTVYWTIEVKTAVNSFKYFSLVLVDVFHIILYNSITHTSKMCLP